jgi:hypothetical protein
MGAVETSLACDYQKIQKNVNAARRVFNWEAQEKVLLRVYGEL